MPEETMARQIITLSRSTIGSGFFFFTYLRSASREEVGSGTPFLLSVVNSK
jgi:hypothetical protein